MKNKSHFFMVVAGGMSKEGLEKLGQRAWMRFVLFELVLGAIMVTGNPTAVEDGVFVSMMLVNGPLYLGTLVAPFMHF